MKKNTILLIALIILIILGQTVYQKFFIKKVKSTNENSNEVSILDSVIELNPNELKTIQTEFVQRTSFQEVISLTGEVVFDPDKVARISARLPGRIISVDFVEGKQVTKNSTLVVLDSPEVSKFRSKYLSSLSKKQAAEKNAKRIRSLVQMNLAAEQEATNAESELRVFESELKSDRESLIVSGINIPDSSSLQTNISGKLNITSPINGLVLERSAIIGSQVESNTVLGMVGDISKVWFSIKIFEKDLSKIKIGSKVEVHLNAYPEIPFIGELFYIGNQLDPNSRTVTGRIVLDNSEMKLKLGLFGKANIYIVTENAISVPKDSTTLINGESYLFIEVQPTKYRVQKVKLGKSSDTKIEVIDGLKENEKIAITNIFLLKSKLLKATFGDE